MSVVVPVTTGGDAVIEEHTQIAPCEAVTKGVLPFCRSPFAVRNWPRMAVMPVPNGRTANGRTAERRNTVDVYRTQRSLGVLIEMVTPQRAHGRGFARNATFSPHTRVR